MAAMRLWSMFAFRVALLNMPVHSEEDTEPDDSTDLPSVEPAEPMSANQIIRLHALMDANGDGKVSLKEIMGHHGTINVAKASTSAEDFFKDLDTSGDGKVSQAEYKASLTWSEMEYEDDEEARKILEQENLFEAAKFEAADVDGDGLLNITELRNLQHPNTHDGVMRLVAAHQIRQKDSDESGHLTKHEFWDLPHDAKGEEGKLSAEEHAQFERLDRDGNGAIDVEEMKDWESGTFHVEGAMKDFLDVADKNADGHVAPDEMVAARDHGAFELFEEWGMHHEL